MTRLESWLQQATRRLSKDAREQVRTEIREHYDSALEAALSCGATADAADASAVAALGDAKAANRKYRQVLLTSAEARMLREGNWEARAICSRPWLKWMLLGVPVAILSTSVVVFLTGSIPLARTLLMVGMAMGFLFAAPFLPVYTLWRGRIYRSLKWVVLLVALTLIFGRDAHQWSWLLISCLWPVLWIERTRWSIRRKLPVANWPRQLYL